MADFEKIMDGSCLICFPASLYLCRFLLSNMRLNSSIEVIARSPEV